MAGGVTIYGSDPVGSSGGGTVTNTAIGTSTTNLTITGGIIETTITVTNANRTIDTSTKDCIVLVTTSSSASTITLPAPVNGRIITVKDIGYNAQTHNITIAQHGSENIDGVAGSLVMTFNGSFVTLTSNGTDWFVISKSSNIGAWAGVSITPGGMGTIGSALYLGRRVGDTFECHGTFTTGTCSVTGLATLGLPYTVDTSGNKISINQTVKVGGGHNLTGTNNLFTVASISNALIFDHMTSDTSLIFTISTNGSSYAESTPNTLFGNATVVDFSFSVPISGWGVY